MGGPGDGAVLALDVGTSSARASLYDGCGGPLAGASGHVAYHPEITADGGAEVNPEHLLGYLYTAIDQALNGLRQPILAVATGTFWHSLLGLDADGRPITPVYVWLDARSRADAAELRKRLSEQAVHARTGCVLHWTYWPAKLTWLRRTQPELFKRVTRWVSFGEFVLQRCTGFAGTSVSMASGTGLLDVHTCRWDAEMLSVVGLEERHLGQLVRLTETSAANASTVARWSALAGVPWLPAVGDGACSNLGAGCATPDHFALMIGTSGAERMVWRPPQPFIIPRGTWCYRVDEQRTVIGGALNDGGSLFGWLRSSLRLPTVSSAEAELATMEADAHGLTVLPFWAGERNPGWADDARGAIIGLRLHTRPVDILRACLEAVGLRFGELDRLLLEAMPASRELVGTGGALLHSPVWMQILADVLGRPLLASAEAEASSRGVSLLALETLGRLEQPLDQLQPVTSRRFEPRPAETERYRAAAQRQRELYATLIR